MIQLQKERDKYDNPLKILTDKMISSGRISVKSNISMSDGSPSKFTSPKKPYRSSSKGVPLSIDDDVSSVGSLNDFSMSNTK